MPGLETLTGSAKAIFTIVDLFHLSHVILKEFLVQAQAHKK